MSVYLTRSVTLRRRAVSGTDEYGNDTFTVVEVTVPGCSWDPRTSSEATDASQQVVSGLWLYCADPAVQIDADDAVIVEGREYEVDGEVGRVTGSLFTNDHAVVGLRRVTG